MHIIDYLIVALYLIFVIVLGVIFERKASQGLDAYFLGNRNIPWWALGASGMAGNVDMAGTMVISALIYALGTKGFFIEIRGGIVLIMAFLMTFMGKWNRRAIVMTSAEWMKFRFGEGNQGKIARIISAIANLLFSVGAMSYFSLAGGKFLGQFLGMDDRAASIVLIVLSLSYTIVSGFYGVVWTDVFQGFLILLSVVYISIVALQTVNLPETFSVSIAGTDTLKTWNLEEWSSITPAWELDLPGDYTIFNMFGGVVFFYLLKTIIEGCSGSGGYIIQRFLAAKNDQEASLLSLFWIILLSFRWPLVTAFAVLGIHYGITEQVIPDPELILPIVIEHYVPIGFKGLLIAAFLAAAMSTFSSIINASAAYWANDIYQAYLRPQARERELVFQSRLSSALIVIIGLLLSFNSTNINQIWGWLTTGLGVGLAIPLLLRWYWWRFNGYGFAIGTAAGMIAAIVTQVVILPLYNHPQHQEYLLFLVPSICSLVGCIVGTLLTSSTDPEVLQNFYNVTRPFGFWGEFSKNLKPNIQAKIKAENLRDIWGTFLAVPWQLTLFLMGIMLIMKQWDNLKILSLVFLLLSISLYFTWFRYLSKEVKISPEQNEFMLKTKE
ncbi:Na+/solute symporter [Gloeothece citriformis PCC 7424]|uniref:Na+/solute symporter n=1 Tax=Gloeothece citriformis (strain PCC 7424) TaxID=65393 RepID=B7KF43_GLOC7|nr:sodium:solute symporter family protein [Gloeothece citriformis]ACK70499.1 Na+/solute symporter [Gloeothece citriformis PCC 7424]